MSTFACAEVRDLAPELAVNIVGGPERAEALDHMSECGPCRAFVAELAEAADALTLLAPEAEPPAGLRTASDRRDRVGPTPVVAAPRPGGGIGRGRHRDREHRRRPSRRGHDDSRPWSRPLRARRWRTSR